MREKVRNLNEAIYVVCFDKPRFVSEISKIVHKSSSYQEKYSEAKVVERIKLLAEEKWLNFLPEYKPLFKKGEKVDGRAERRKYYISTLNPLIDQINEQISLNSFEEHALRMMIDSKTFRHFYDELKKESSVDFRTESNPISHIIMMLDFLAIIYTRFISSNDLLLKIKENIDPKITNEQQFDLSISVEDPLFAKVSGQIFEVGVENLRKISPRNPIFKFITDKNYVQDLMNESSIFMNTPLNLMDKIRGITTVGQFDNLLYDTLYSKTPALGELFESVFQDIKIIISKLFSDHSDLDLSTIQNELNGIFQPYKS